MSLCQPLLHCLSAEGRLRAIDCDSQSAGVGTSAEVLQRIGRHSTSGQLTGERSISAQMDLRRGQHSAVRPAASKADLRDI